MVFTALLDRGFSQPMFPISEFPNCPQPQVPAATLSTDCMPQISHNGSWSSLYSLGMDCTKTPLPIVLLFWHSCLLRPSSDGYRATRVCEWSSGNGCLCWLRNSDFKQTCSNTHPHTRVYTHQLHKDQHNFFVPKHHSFLFVHCSPSLVLPLL
jgi:hypothetical protein